MGELELLTDEIRRVITAPYAVWLKNLRDIIDKVDKAIFQRWADGHPCQINALAKTVIDGLRLWPYVIDLLGDLCHIAAFRNAVLSTQPALLDTLLRKATESQHGYEEYFSACISMLSAPLPEDTSLPALAPAFFLKVMEAAVQAPSASTVRPIYLMLTGLGPGLLEVLPEAEVIQFQERLIRLLRSLDDQSANLLCLAIFAKIATGLDYESPAETSSAESTSMSLQARPHQASQYHAIRQFFGPKRAAKTLDLVVLRVIFACSSSSNLSLGDAVESLKLAVQIIAVVDLQQKEEWLKSNGSKARKMFEKILRVDICPELQSLAFEVIVSMVRVDDIPPQLLKTYQSLIHVNGRLVTSEVAGTNISARVIEAIGSRFNESFVNETMKSILETAVEQVVPSNEVLGRAQTAITVVSSFAVVVQRSPQLRSAVLFMLSANASDRLLSEFLALPPLKVCDIESCEKHNVCPATFAKTLGRLRLDICSLFLTTAFLASADQAGMDAGLAVSLLKKQVQFATVTPHCRFARPYFQQSTAVSLVEQTSTPCDGLAGKDWRARLCTDLLRDAKNSSDTIIRTVGEVCRDLESRCQLVEQPLKAEQAQVVELKTQLERSSARIVELESQVDDCNLFLNGLTADKARLEERVLGGEDRLTHLLDNLRHVDSKLADARAEAERAAAASAEEANEQELKHIAIVTCKEETIDEQAAQILQLERGLKDSRDELAVTLEAKHVTQRRINELETDSVETARLIQVERALNAEKVTEIETLRRVELRLRTEVEAAENVVRQHATKIEALENEVENTRVSTEQDLKRLKHLHGSERLAAAAEAARSAETHQEEIARLSAKHQEAIETATLMSCDKDSTISELEKRIGKLLKDRKEKAKEFAEAQDLSSKLMAVMGPKTEQATSLAPNMASSGHCDIFVDSEFGGQDVRRQRNTASAQSFESNTSSKSGPTPKRTRPRRNTRTPSMQQTKIDVGAKTAKIVHDTRSQSTRQVLKDLGVSVHNKSPMKTQQHGLGKWQQEQDSISIAGEDQDEELMDFGDLSFGGSDVFTSTGKEPSPPQDKAESHLDDETTADL